MTNAAIRVLELETAPRDVPGLCQFGSYALYKFAEKIGMITDPSVDAAFQQLGKSERAERVAEALKAFDAKNGRAPAAQAAAPAQPAPAAPATAPVAGPTPVVSGAPAPAVTGRKPRNSAAAAPAAPAAPAASAPGVDSLGLLSQLKDELATIKANQDGFGKNLLDLTKQVEPVQALNTKLDAIVFMLAQLGEAVLGAPAQDFVNDAFKAAQAQGKG